MKPAAIERPEMTGAEALIKCLEAQGVEVVFGYPGGQAVDIYDALYDSDKIEHILVRNEQGAALAADGYARSTGKPGVVLVTSGPGATNTVTGIATSYMDSVPIVVICGQVPTTNIGTDAFQESDITGITMPIVKHSYLVTRPEDLCPSIREAFHIASTGRPAPVLIDVPSNIAKATVEFEYPEEIRLQSYKPTYKGNARQVKQAVQLIAEAKRPVLYAGGGVVSSSANEVLLELAHLIQVPVVTTLMAKGAFPYDDPLALGMSGIHGAHYANLAMNGSDLIVAVGARFSDRVTGRPDRFAPEAKVIHIDIDPAEIGKNRAVDVPIVGDARTVLTSILSELRKTGVRPDTADWLKQVAAWREEYPLHEPLRDGQITAREILEILNRLCDDGTDTIFTTDVGQHQMWAAQYLKVAEPRHFLSSGGLGTMGFGFPAALGAQKAHPGSRVICITGDGSFQMNVQEMATCTANQLPVKVILFDNRTLGLVYQWQDAYCDGRHSHTELDPIPDFVKLADAYGWYGARISDPAGLEDALVSLLACEGPGLLDVALAPDEFVYPMVEPGGPLDEAVDLDADGNPTRLSPTGRDAKEA